MKYTLAINDFETLDLCQPIQFDELLINTEIATKLGSVKLFELDKIIDFGIKNNLKLVINIDILLTDQKLDEIIFKFEENKVFNQFQAIRFLDKGIGYYCQKKHPQLPLQLILEHESHNLIAIENWIQYFSPQLEKVILSNEIPFTILKKIQCPHQVQVELLGSGQIEIFYSSRSLLGSQFSDEDLDFKLYSKDRPSSLRNNLIENVHGSLLFYERELYILDCHQELKIANIDSLLIVQDKERLQILINLMKDQDWCSLFKEYCPHTTKGFFKVNKTDTQFKRLKNTKQNYDSTKKIGWVIEQVKNSHLVLQLFRSIEKKSNVIFHSPEGYIIPSQLNSIKLMNNQSASEQLQSGYYKLPWIPKALPKTIITLE